MVKEVLVKRSYKEIKLIFVTTDKDNELRTEKTLARFLGCLGSIPRSIGRKNVS